MLICSRCGAMVDTLFNLGLHLNCKEKPLELAEGQKPPTNTASPKLPQFLDITVSEVSALSPVRPLFGHRSGKQSKTHWLVFQKDEDGAQEIEEAVANGPTTN